MLNSRALRNPIIEKKGKKVDFASVMKFLQQFETDKVIDYLKTLNLQELIKNPYFLGGTGALGIIAFLMRWKVLLVVILTLAGFVALLSYTLEQGTSLEGGVANDALLVFVGGGAIIVFMVIYLLFIRGE
jgi:hypothetical protein